MRGFRFAENADQAALGGERAMFGRPMPAPALAPASAHVAKT